MKNLELTDLAENTMMKESDLKGHLENTDKEKLEDKAEKQDKKLRSDYQLSEAINLLKGLNILSSREN